MEKMKTRNQQTTCPSCGATVVSEICAYCGTPTGLDTASAYMEYPVLECKEATLSFWTVWFPMIFAVSFGMGSLITLGMAMTGIGSVVLLLTGFPFFVISAAAFCFAFRTISRYLKVKKKGTVIQAVVYGYMNDEVLINGQPAQIVKLLIQTSDGPRFILYQLGNTLKTYGINDKIDVMVYRNYFMICKN